MEYQRIAVSMHKQIATITIRDPERRNAMSLEIRRELLAAFRSLEDSGEVDCVLVTGEGDKAFSAGADINEVKTRSLTGELATAAQLRRELTRLVETMRLPTIACINGWCLGAGLEFALACTFRIAADNARLGLPEINLGVIPGSGGTQRLARLIGLGRAMEMVLLGEPVDAVEAQRIGLINRAVPATELMETGLELARKLQAKGAVSLMAARDAVLKSPDLDLVSGLDYENKLFALCIASGERDEGVAAFLEKRKARFR